MGTPWVFTQLGGLKQTMRLEGLALPHGRPRQSPIVTDGFELRETEVFYSGQEKPTRLIFGARHDDLELKGRFDDRELGVSGANLKILEIKAFIAEMQPVKVSWGSNLTMTGLLKKITAARESPKQLAYTLTMRIDSDDLLDNTDRAEPEPFSPANQAEQVVDLLQGIIFIPVPARGVYKPTILELLEALAYAVSIALVQFVDAANQISNLVDATLSSLSRLTSSIGLLGTAVERLWQTIESVDDEGNFLVQSAEAKVQFYADKLQSISDACVAQALLNDTEVRAEIASRGNANRGIVAVEGDTWESLASKYLGGPSGADKLRQANGARFGEQPVPGRTLKIPSR